MSVRTEYTLPARCRIVELVQDIKVFWFFSSEKNAYFSIISLIRPPSASSENGFVAMCMPGFR